MSIVNLTSLWTSIHINFTIALFFFFQVLRYSIDNKNWEFCESWLCEVQRPCVRDVAQLGYIGNAGKFPLEGLIYDWSYQNKVGVLQINDCKF